MANLGKFETKSLIRRKSRLSRLGMQWHLLCFYPDVALGYSDRMDMPSKPNAAIWGALLNACCVGIFMCGLT